MNRLHRTRRPAAVVGALVLGLAATTAAQAKDQACAQISKQEVAGLFDRWNSSLATLDPDRVTANYEDHAVLLPTVSNGPLATHDEIRGYFVDFLKKEPQGTIDKRTIKVSCNTAKDVGTYTFRFKDGSTVSARYTFVYAYDDGKWLISHHHSSAMPEKMAVKH